MVATVLSLPGAAGAATDPPPSATNSSSAAPTQMPTTWTGAFATTSPRPVATQSIAGTLILGVVLNNALNQVQATIRDAGTVASGTAMVAGTTLTATIDNARVAFFKDLDKRIKDLNKATRDRVEQLQTLVDKFARDLHSTAEQVTTSAQQIANTLPLTNKQPQVRNYNPDFVAGGAAGTVRVTVRGNFVHAAQKKYQPVLRAGALKLRPTEVTTQRLSFEVPPAALPTGSPSAIVPASLRLEVPYPRRALVVFTRTERAVFHVQLGVVPPSPGTLSYTPTIDVPQASRSTLTSGKIKVDSDARDKDESALLGPLLPGPGCQLLADSAQFVRTWARGNENISWKWRWANLTSAGALAEIYAIDHPWWDIYADGGLEGYIQVDQTCDFTIAEQQQPVAVLLKWGEQRVVSTAGASSWKVIFSSFDGRTVEVGNEGYSERFLRISCCTPEGGLTLQAPSLDDVKW